MEMDKARIADYLSSSEGQEQLLEAVNHRNERIEECIDDIKRSQGEEAQDGT